METTVADQEAVMGLGVWIMFWMSLGLFSLWGTIKDIVQRNTDSSGFVGGCFIAMMSIALGSFGLHAFFTEVLPQRIAG